MGGSPTWSGGSCARCDSVSRCDLSVCSRQSDASCKAGRCQQGYEVGGNECVPSACDSMASNIDHAVGTCTGHTGDTCSTFRCELGYKTRGTLRCGVDGHWTGGSCVGESCTPSTAPHASAPCSGDYPNRCALQCQPGYYPSGDMRCGRDHKFSGGSCDECDAIERCPIQLQGLHCTKPGDSTCSQCVAGYEPTDDRSACIGVQCTALFTPAHGAVIAPGAVSALRYPSTIAFACDAGFVLSDSSNRSCTTDGSWNPPHFPHCIETCELSPCKNGATCTEAARTQQFHCECTAEEGKPLWEGKRCDQNINECRDPGRLGRVHPWPLNGGCDYSLQDDGSVRPI
eukprot:COSAG01_NODE_18853_length_1049_cov_0.883158_1_plen_342_part_10